MTSTNWLDLLNEAKQSGGGQDFGPVPAGEYQMKVLSAETRQTANGKTKYTIKAEIQNGPHASRFVWDDLIVSPESAGAMGFFFRKMKALGLGPEFFQSAPTDDQITTALTGRDFLGKVIVENYANKDRNKIDGYKPLASPGAGGFIPAAPQAAAPAQSAPQPPQAAPAQAPGANPWETAAPQPQGAPPAPAAPQAAPPAPAPGNSPWDTPSAPPAAPGAPNFPAPPF